MYVTTGFNWFNLRSFDTWTHIMVTPSTGDVSSNNWSFNNKKITLPPIIMEVGKWVLPILSILVSFHFRVIFHFHDGRKGRSQERPKPSHKKNCQVANKNLANLSAPFLTVWEEQWTVHPRKLTCPLKGDYFFRKYIFQPLIFGGHVRFSGSNMPAMSTCNKKTPYCWWTKWEPVDMAKVP